MQIVISAEPDSGAAIPVIQDSTHSLVVQTEHYAGRMDWEAGLAKFNVQPGFEPFGRTNAFRIVRTVLAYREGGFVLHAGAAMKNGEATLFCGPSGAGKTTTLSRLARPILHDDLVCIHPSGSRAHGLTDSRPLAWAPVALEGPRYPVHAVFVLAQGEKSRRERLSPARAVADLLLRPQVEGAAVTPDQLMERMLRFLERVPAFKLTLNLSDLIEPFLEEATA
ncbi:MAG: hypothetical protein HYT87_04770 [Nitrospirae bacterium]|nr:hypothetical protein [Nitrospirota bacterium]